MKNQDCAVAVYPSHELAEKAIGKLQKAGYSMSKLSIIGKDYHTDENVVGYFNTGDRMKKWGGQGAFWGGLWGLLFGSAFFIIPGVGPLLIAGPFVASLIAGLEGAVVVGGLSALGAALVSVGIPKDSVIQYETEIKAGKFVLIAHGTPDEVADAKETLGIKSAPVLSSL
jgi:uncharacterized membrane protein